MRLPFLERAKPSRVGSLQTAFEESVRNAISAKSICAPIVARKLAQQGIVLSKRRLSQLMDAALGENRRPFAWDRWRFWKRRSISVVLTEADTQEALRVAQEILVAVPEIFAESSDEIAKMIRKEMGRSWGRTLRNLRKDRAGFVSKVAGRWQPVLDHLRAFILIAHELGSRVNDELRATASDAVPAKADALTRLHARACQVSEEVIALLSQGYAEGALARWRTLHEIAVVMSFLAEGDDDAERFLCHSTIQSQEGARKCDAACERLGMEAISESERAALKVAAEELVERYGDPYREQYGWAAHRLQNKRPNFADIERAVGVDQLRPYYWFASHRVHSNAHAMFQRLGTVEDYVLLAGASDSGFEDPNQLTAISLGQATAALTHLHPTADHIISAKVLSLVHGELKEQIGAVVKEHEAESDPVKT